MKTFFNKKTPLNPGSLSKQCLSEGVTSDEKKVDIEPEEIADDKADGID
jgi:hypothetical protein